MSQTASSGSTSASKDATLEPTEKCSTIYGLRKDELEARNNARGLATEWQDGTVMTKEELIAEEHMWEMRIPEDLKVSMRSFVAELERDLVPQVRAKGEALGIPATSTVKSDMIGDILLSIRGLHSRGEALPSLEDVLKKGGKKQASSSQNKASHGIPSIFSQPGKGSSTAPKGPFKTASTLFGSNTEHRSPASSRSSASVPDLPMDTDLHSDDDGASDVVNFKDAALASLAVSFVKHVMATAPDRFNTPANPADNAVRNHLDKFHGRLNVYNTQLVQFEESMQAQREIVAQALQKMDELARDAHASRVKIVELLEELFAPI